MTPSVDPNNQVTEFPQETDALEDLCYHVIVHDDDFSVCELLAVPARAARFSRRMARAEWKAAGHNDSGLTFNARNAGPENHA